MKAKFDTVRQVFDEPDKFRAKDGGLMELRTAWRNATFSVQRQFVSELERDGHLDAPEPQEAVR